MSRPNVGRILKLLDRLDARQYVQRIAEATASDALASGASSDLAPHAREALEALARYFVTRDK